MAVGRINGVAALTGFYYKKMYGHFAGTKKSGRNNEVAVRRGSTVFTTIQRDHAALWLYVSYLNELYAINNTRAS